MACTSYRVEEWEPEHLVVRLRLAPGYAPDEVFLLLVQGTLEGLPDVLGHPPRVVPAPDASGLCYHVHLARPPRSGSGRRALSWLFAARHAAASLERAYDELGQSASRYWSIFNATSDGMVIGDLDGTILEANPAACRIFGYSAEEFVALDLQRLVPFEARGPYRRYLEGIGAGRSVEVEQGALHRDGSVLRIELHGSPIEYEGRRCALSVVRDVSERARAEAERLALEEQLRQAQKMEAIGRVAGGLAHDFNNLLTVITGYTELLSEGRAKGDEAAEAVEQIRMASDRGAGLTRQLLAFSRGGGAGTEAGAVEPNAIISRTRKMLARLIGEDIELVTELDPDAGWVEVDGAQLEQALVNLALNARDAMPRGGRLTLATRTRKGDDGGPSWLSIRVADTGRGMTPEVRARVFEPFFTTKEMGRGTGLGLATVFGFARQSGGRIRVESEPDRGSRFELLLPRREQAGDAGAEEEAAGEPGARPGETVLLVEDERMLRDLVRAALATAGYEVLDASDGEAALTLLRTRREPVSLVLADVVMPRMSGVELAIWLRREAPDTGVLLMSGYADEPRVGPLPPDAHFLAKPFRRDGLLRAVRRVLDDAC